MPVTQSTRSWRWSRARMPTNERCVISVAARLRIERWLGVNVPNA
jgi:hypothetical protein